MVVPIIRLAKHFRRLWLIVRTYMNRGSSLAVLTLFWILMTEVWPWLNQTLVGWIILVMLWTNACLLMLGFKGTLTHGDAKIFIKGWTNASSIFNGELNSTKLLYFTSWISNMTTTLCWLSSRGMVFPIDKGIPSSFSHTRSLMRTSKDLWRTPRGGTSLGTNRWLLLRGNSKNGIKLSLVTFSAKIGS